MSHLKARSAGVLALGAALIVPIAVAAPAMAKDGNGGGGGGAAVTARGACAGVDGFKLKAKHDDGRIQVEFELDADVAGQVWNVSITDNGKSIFAGARTTGVDGFEVAVRPVDLAGPDVIRAVATRGARMCGGTVTLP